ncbi:hypothetical protein HJA87_21140 [Rhizobium bangladeshense]|uniref:Outer membrane protein assembly factor BamE n=1 Tax=Rhizobium bangladeshense TaxID=1138189 RepID=A0ABS7LMQ7_9HYPH|nr:hypothetical protein [Rhizobium bangladeshense]MBY3592361.1 hypothetical protein [Rhizobium bangladeshense]
MKRGLFERVRLLFALAVLAGCVSAGDDDAKIIRAVAGLKGQPRDSVIAALGPPNRTTIENGRTTSYWLMTEVEQYVGVSNKRTVSRLNGNNSVSESMGVKLKEHRHECFIEIKSDPSAIIITSEIIGSAVGCSAVVTKLNLRRA